jgi:hypothetical protein
VTVERTDVVPALQLPEPEKPAATFMPNAEALLSRLRELTQEIRQRAEERAERTDPNRY